MAASVPPRSGLLAPVLNWIEDHVPFSHGFHVSLTAVALVGGILFALLWALDAAAKGQLQSGQEAADRALTSHRATVRRLTADSSRLAASDRSIAVLTAQHVADQTRFATLLATTPVQASDTALVHACVQTTQSCEAVRDSLTSQKTLLEQDLAAAKADGAMVADSLHRLRQASVCHLLNAGPIHAIGCPDWKVTTAVGAVLGAIARGAL